MESIHRALPKAKVTNAYGTTEAGPVVFGPHPENLPQPDDSVGYPHPKVQLRLVDGGNQEAKQGVLEMKCPALMNGYHNRPKIIASTTANRIRGPRSPSSACRAATPLRRCRHPRKPSEHNATVFAMINQP